VVERNERLRSVDAALKEWRQGDYVLGEQWLVVRFDASCPVTEGAQKVSGSDPDADLVELGVRGLVVLTQTCDVVRDCMDRPYVEVAPLVEVAASELHQVRRGYLPKYAAVPGLDEQCLVADLDRVMTVEKAVVASWTRGAGCKDDGEARLFADALTRKRSRFAFPDDFTDVVGDLVRRLRDKHDKNSEEGRALRALREIRVQAEPAWDAAEVKLFFWFVRELDIVDFAGKPWATWLDGWLGRITKAGRYTAVSGAVVSLTDMTAADYVASDRLDLDHLSRRGTAGA
jgi:hypothetical protein